MAARASRTLATWSSLVVDLTSEVKPLRKRAGFGSFGSNRMPLPRHLWRPLQGVKRGKVEGAGARAVRNEREDLVVAGWTPPQTWFSPHGF